MTDLVVVEEFDILTVEGSDDLILEQIEVTEILTDAEQGPPGPAGPIGGQSTVTVGAQPISGHSAVACDSAGLLVPADSTDPTHRGAVLGLTESAYSPGMEATVQTQYVIEHSGWTWAVGPVFVGVDGGLVQTLPVGALFSQAIGQALSATRVLIDVQPPITIA